MPNFPTTRASLIAGIGDPSNAQAWADFTELYQPVIYRLVRGKGLQHSDAEDITQEVLVKVADAAASWNSEGRQGAFRKWLVVVLRNLVIQRFARKGLVAKATEAVGGTGERELDFLCDDSTKLAEDIEIEAQLEAFRIAARRVRPEFSEATWHAFWKTWVDEMPIKSTAEELGITVGATYIARSRVMQRLREVASRLYGDIE